MRAWLVGAVIAVGGCIEPQLTLCGDGTACPASLACDLAHASCVAPDQLTACAGTADGGTCHTAELDGQCFGGVCLAPGCGNKVIEAGEQCDDGNHTGGDGCSADCRSDERCGNGVLDASLGEQCDDGNLASHDGCDSRCQTETAAWQMYPAAVHDVSVAAFDAAHGRLVMAGHRVTWLWDGSAWTTPMSLMPDADSWNELVYDSDRGRVVAFGQRNAIEVVAEWDGTHWTELAIGGVGPTLVYAAAYDPVHHVIVWLDTQNIGELDLAAATPAWSSTSLLPFQYGGARIGFDVSRATLVVVDAQGGGTWEWDGTMWTFLNVAPAGAAGHSLVFDGDRGHLLAIGGADSNGPSGNALGSVFAWSGTTWDDTGARIPPRESATVWYDATRHVIGVAGGFSPQPMSSMYDVLDLDGTTVTTHPIVQPTNYGPLAYDAGADRIITLDAAGTYAWRGAWQQVSATSLHPSSTTLVYDPRRGHVVAVDTNQPQLLELANDWQVLVPGTPGQNAATYDYARGGLVQVTGGGAFLLPSDGTAFSAIAAAPPSVAFYAGYDIAATRVSILGNGALTDLVGDQWEPSLSPAGRYAPITALQTRSLVLVPIGGGSQLWERRDGLFQALDPMPFPAQIESATAASRGRLVLEVDDAAGLVFLVRQLSSGLPDETCAPGEDADHDGLAGCADPDCWETCWPACPVATSCP